MPNKTWEQWLFQKQVDEDDGYCIPGEPCGYCGSTDGYYTWYDGWPRCLTCHGC